MNRNQFRQLVDSRPIILDGATGTELFKRGLPAGVAPEKWVMENPHAIQTLQAEYFDAGSDIVLACTFGANRLKLADHGLDDRARDMNIALARISRAAVPDGRFCFGDIAPTGQLVEPFGPLPFEEAVAIYRAQAEALMEGGVDGFMIETMMDIQEARAALLGVREAAPDMPVICGMTYDKHGKSLGGTRPSVALVTLQALGADAVGCNCSTGPDEMILLLEEMLEYARVPLFIKPNAGMPCLKDGHEHYNQTPDVFAKAVMRGIGLGARIVGGCCGTTPGHIKAVRALLDDPSSAPAAPARTPRTAISSSRGMVDFSDSENRRAPLRVVGERINPTGKKTFQAELLKNDLGRILVFAEEQIAAGADLLDVNLGLGGIDEASLMRQTVGMLAPAITVPLAIDSVNPQAMEAALRLYPGRALVNSVSGETNRLDHILPLAAKYGAMIIVLPVGEGFIPATPEERMAVTRDIVAKAEALGMRRDDMLVDGLAMTVSAEPGAGMAALDFIADCAAQGLKTILGLSNVSFGMPERQWLNAVFLAMGAGRGLSAVIANPSAELLMSAKAAADVLANRHDATTAYIDRFGQKREPDVKPPKTGDTVDAGTPAVLASQAVRKGNVKGAGDLAKLAVMSGVKAGSLVSDHLVPAIMKAGELFEKGEYYLPQLMLAGEAMRLALAAIEPDLVRERLHGVETKARGRVVMATVKGDVHDIGKNLVTLMLRNHGFDVLDLGKDVAIDTIIETAKQEDPDVVGLSALMTTTLAAMRDTIAAARSAGVKARFMVGGAAVTQHFADEAGADGFAPDAVSAVKLAAKLTKDKAK